MTDQPEAQPAQPERKRVSVDAEVWRLIDQTLAELPYKVAAPLVNALQQTGGVQPL